MVFKTTGNKSNIPVKHVFFDGGQFAQIGDEKWRVLIK